MANQHRWREQPVLRAGDGSSSQAFIPGSGKPIRGQVDQAYAKLGAATESVHSPWNSSGQAINDDSRNQYQHNSSHNLYLETQGGIPLGRRAGVGQGYQTNWEGLNGRFGGSAVSQAAPTTFHIPGK